MTAKGYTISRSVFQSRSSSICIFFFSTNRNWSVLSSLVNLHTVHHRFVPPWEGFSFQTSSISRSFITFCAPRSRPFSIFCIASKNRLIGVSGWRKRFVISRYSLGSFAINGNNAELRGSRPCRVRRFSLFASLVFHESHTVRKKSESNSSLFYWIQRVLTLLMTRRVWKKMMCVNRVIGCWHVYSPCLDIREVNEIVIWEMDYD